MSNFLFNILKLYVSPFKNYMAATVIPEVELQIQNAQHPKYIISKNKQTVYKKVRSCLILPKMVKYLALKNM